MNRFRQVFGLFVGLGVAVGCSKSPSTDAPAGAPSAAVSAAQPAASALAAASPSAETPVAAPGEPTRSNPTKTATPTPDHPKTAAQAEPARVEPAKTVATVASAKAAATTTTAVASAAAEPKTFACGAKGQPLCPTQAWMKGNMAPSVASEDTAALGKQFDYVAARAPAGFGNWSAIAKGGAAKAKASDIVGAKAACKACHDQYKVKYKAEIRDRPF